MSDNKCVNCGQWSGKGHKCPPVTAPTVAVAPTPVATLDRPTDVDDRVARAQAFLTTPKPPEVNLRELGVQIDDRLAELYDAQFYHQQRYLWAIDTLHRDAGHKKDRQGHWDGELKDAIEAAKNKSYPSRALADFEHERDILAQINLETSEGNQVWREHRWSRAFLVINANGHVHKDMDCSTCFESTRYEWLTHYSGADEAEIVGDAGETACTVCYASAPAEVLNRPANLVSKSRQEKEAARAERDAAKAERERKRIAKAATADGSDLWIPQGEWSFREKGERLTNEVTATSTWTSIELNKASDYERSRPTEAQLESQRIIEEALAAKHGRTVEEQVAILKKKAEAKAKRNR